MARVLKVEGGIVQVEAGRCDGVAGVTSAQIDARVVALLSGRDRRRGGRRPMLPPRPLSSMVPWRTLLWRAASLLLLKTSGTTVSPSTSLL